MGRPQTNKIGGEKIVTTTEKITRIWIGEPRVKAYCPNCQKEWWVTKDQKYCPLCDEWLIPIK